jgi:hypothetical protein
MNWTREDLSFEEAALELHMPIAKMLEHILCGDLNIAFYMLPEPDALLRVLDNNTSISNKDHSYHVRGSGRNKDLFFIHEDFAQNMLEKIANDNVFDLSMDELIVSSADDYQSPDYDYIYKINKPYTLNYDDIFISHFEVFSLNNKLTGESKVNPENRDTSEVPVCDPSFSENHDDGRFMEKFGVDISGIIEHQDVGASAKKGKRTIKPGPGRSPEDITLVVTSLFKQFLESGDREILRVGQTVAFLKCLKERSTTEKTIEGKERRLWESMQTYAQLVEYVKPTGLDDVVMMVNPRLAKGADGKKYRGKVPYTKRYISKLLCELRGNHRNYFSNDGS